MAGIVIADTGPLLVFLCCNRERLLLSILTNYFDEVIVHEAVDVEVRRKTKQTRFASGARTWTQLVDGGHIRVVSEDDEHIDRDRFEEHVLSLSKAPYESWKPTSKDVGETMSTALAHSNLDLGVSVALYVDDGGGQRLASMPRADGLRISIINTETLLKLGVRLGLITDRGEMRKIWQQFRDYDDGFPGIEATQLLSTSVWKPVTATEVAAAP